MQKDYSIKIYNLDHTFNKVLNPVLQVGDISFSSEINNGQGELVIKLDLKFDSVLVAYNNIIEVFLTDDNHKNVRIYAGIVSKVNRVAQKQNTYIEVTVIGLSSMLSWIYYTNAGAYSFTKNQAQDVTLKEVIDYFSTRYPNLISYTGTSVEASGSNANLDFSYSKCANAIDSIIETTQFWWTIGADGVFQFHPKSGSPYMVEHKLTLDKEVDSLEVEEDIEGIVNKYILSFGGVGSPYIATDAGSQSTYGLRELREDISDIKDLATATVAGDALIADRKDKKKKIKMTVNSSYDIESIQPGHFVTIYNTEYGISLLQILRIDYNMDSVTLEVDKIKSFAQEIFTS